MNGDQQPQTPDERQPKTSDSPTMPAKPNEPMNKSELRRSSPAVIQTLPAADKNTGVQVAEPNHAERSDEDAQFYHPETATGADHNVATPLSAISSESHFATKVARAREEEVVTWTSSGESLQAHSAAWRVRMTVASLVAAAVIFLITRDWVSTVAVVLAGTAFGFLGSRRPTPLEYRMDGAGITIGQRRYSYAEFRAFSVTEYPAPSANLIPLKRFLPVLSINFDASQQDKIMSILGNHLPMEQHKNDAMDKIISRVRF